MTVSGLHKKHGMIPGLKGGLPELADTTDNVDTHFLLLIPVKASQQAFPVLFIKLLGCFSRSLLSSESDYCQKQVLF